jgi:DNA mismatch repair protein MutS
MFQSILFEDPNDASNGNEIAVPEFFADLNLDRVVGAVVAGKEEYDLTSFFYRTLHDINAVNYRHEIMQDLENAELFAHVGAFASELRRMRAYIAQAQKFYYKRQKERLFLEAVNVYCDAITTLVGHLTTTKIASRGFREFNEYLTRYVASARFTSLLDQTKTLLTDLLAVRYKVLINGGRVEVLPYAGERDYSVEVAATFATFRQGSIKDYRFDLNNTQEMNDVEARILDLVAVLYPDTFSTLEAYTAANKHYQDAKISAFDREIQFYIGYLEYVMRFAKAGFDFCYPQITQFEKQVYNYRGFDLALAGKLIEDGATVVRNDFHIRNRERIIVISGPNQGGKTTFARTFGQLHYLASLGLPVPGTQAQLFLFDKLFTHFEKEENIKDLRGKLQDDLIRIRNILAHATPSSILIMNEIFTSTTLHDALVLSKKIAEKIIALDLVCVWVTFVEEMASLSEQTVSMVSEVVPETPSVRTFKIVRRPADGLAYAMSIAEKYRLTSDMIKARIAA